MDEKAIAMVLFFTIQFSKTKFTRRTSGKWEVVQICDVAQTLAVEFSFPGWQKSIFESVGETIVRNFEEVELTSWLNFECVFVG